MTSGPNSAPIYPLTSPRRHRSQGLTIAWTGGDAVSYIEIVGTSFVPVPAASLDAFVLFVCMAGPGPGQFVIPSYVLETQASASIK